MNRITASLISLVLMLSLVGSVSGFSGTGSGTEVDPYVITDANQLQEMQESLSAWYELVNDINAFDTVTWNSGAGFVPIGDNAHSFVGHLQGNGFVISGLYIYRINTNYVGLFGIAGSNATIDNVTLAHPNVTGNDYTGSLAGYSEISPGNCHCSQAYVKGHDYVGGFAGENAATGNISKCYSTGSVTGSYNLGGFDGWNSGTSSYNYWDNQTSGQTTSASGTGKSTEHMMQHATFEPEWDFEAVWGIDEGQSYPVLTVFTKTCGDPWHLYPIGDLNFDCHVDLLDLGELASHWLECTASECD